MNRLVVIRVGEPALWNSLHSTGRWSSPESHTQAVRDLIVEGYTVIALFVGRGDVPLAAVKVLNVRERLIEDSLFPIRSDLGDLRTFLEFDPQSLMNLEHGFTITYTSAIQSIRYQIGSQIAISPNFSREFLNYFLIMSNDQPYRGNMTFLVPDSLSIPPLNPVNFVI